MEKKKDIWALMDMMLSVVSETNLTAKPVALSVWAIQIKGTKHILLPETTNMVQIPPRTQGQDGSIVIGTWKL